MSYNSWLREEANDSRDMLKLNTETLQALLLDLQSVLQRGTYMEVSRILRITTAVSHLTTEILLLDITRTEL